MRFSLVLPWQPLRMNREKVCIILYMYVVHDILQMAPRDNKKLRVQAPAGVIDMRRES